MTNFDLDAAQAIASHRRKPLGTVAASGRIYFWQSGSLWIGNDDGAVPLALSVAHGIGTLRRLGSLAERERAVERMRL